jgi:hypothetical protein
MPISELAGLLLYLQGTGLHLEDPHRKNVLLVDA